MQPTELNLFRILAISNRYDNEKLDKLVSTLEGVGQELIDSSRLYDSLTGEAVKTLHCTPLMVRGLQALLMELHGVFQGLCDTHGNQELSPEQWARQCSEALSGAHEEKLVMLADAYRRIRLCYDDYYQVMVEPRSPSLEPRAPHEEPTIPDYAKDCMALYKQHPSDFADKPSSWPYEFRDIELNSNAVFYQEKLEQLLNALSEPLTPAQKNQTQKTLQYMAGRWLECAGIAEKPLLSPFKIQLDQAVLQLALLEQLIPHCQTMDEGAAYQHTALTIGIAVYEHNAAEYSALTTQAVKAIVSAPITAIKDAQFQTLKRSPNLMAYFNSLEGPNEDVAGEPTVASVLVRRAALLNSTPLAPGVADSVMRFLFFKSEQPGMAEQQELIAEVGSPALRDPLAAAP